PWHEEVLQVVAAAGARIGAKRRASIAELSRQPWLLREAGSGTRQVAQRELRRRGIRPARQLELGSNEAIARAVAEGAGVALLPEVVVHDLVAMGRVRVLRLAGDAAIRRPLFRLELADRPRAPALQAFVGLVEAVARDCRSRRHRPQKNPATWVAGFRRGERDRVAGCPAGEAGITCARPWWRA